MLISKSQFSYTPTFAFVLEKLIILTLYLHVLSNLLIVILLANSYCQFVGAFNTLVHFFLTDVKVELF